MSVTSAKCTLFRNFKSESINYDSDLCPRIYFVNSGTPWHAISASDKYYSAPDDTSIVGTEYTNSSGSTEDYLDISFLKYLSNGSKVAYRVVRPGSFLTFDKSLGTFYCANSYLEDSQSKSSASKDYNIYWDDSLLRIGDNIYNKSQFKDGVIPTRLFCFLQAGGGGGGGYYSGWDSEGAGGGGSGGWVLAILKRPASTFLCGNLRVGCGGEGGSPNNNGAKGSDSWIELYDYYDEENTKETATAVGGYGGRSSYDDNLHTGAGGSGGGYTIYNGSFIENYSVGYGVGGLAGGRACKGNAGAFYSQYVSPITFTAHGTDQAFGSSHSAGLVYYNNTNNDGGCGGDSMFSTGGPGCTARLSYSGGYEYSYIPNYTRSSGYITESTWASHKRWSNRNISTPGAGAGGGGASPDMQYDINRWGGDGGDGLAMFFC